MHAPSVAAAPAARPAPALRGAALALLYLAGSVALAFPAGRLATDAAERLGLGVSPATFRLVLLACGAAGGALWGRAVARAAGRGPVGRVAAGAALGFGVSVALAAAGLAIVETALLAHAQGGGAVPMHVAFALLFPAATGLVVLATAGGAALGARTGAAGALRVAGPCALAATATFLAIAVGMDAAGWRVGAPNAEARFTMVVVTAVGLLAATPVAGALALRRLARTGA